MLEVGTLLAGRYVIEAVQASGGMSVVYRAGDLRNPNAQLAVKEIKTGSGQLAEHLLKREASLLARLRHPNIVAIQDVFVQNDVLYVVTEYLDGITLQAVVNEQGAQPEERVYAWALQLCDALAYLHAQKPPVIYRDMKPGNVMLLSDGTVKLVDLGIAREYDEANVDEKDTVTLGTHGYAPPEQYGAAQTDPRADIYALGATLWHLLAGEVPPASFPLPNIAGKNAQVSPHMQHIIATCTALEKEKRYQTCQQLVRALNARPQQKKGLLERIAPLASRKDGKQTGLARGAQALTVQENAGQTSEKPRTGNTDAEFSFIMTHDELVVHTKQQIEL